MLLKEFSAEGSAARPRNRIVGQARDYPREVRAAVYLLVVLTAGAYLPSPLYPGYQHDFAFSDLTMTLVYAMFALVSAPALLLFGPAADAFGPRAVLRSSVVVAALASTCFVLVAGPGWLLAGRAAQGLALGAATGAATALITEHAAGENRTRAAVVASMAFVAGTSAGPLAGGVLAEYAPAPQVLPYAVHLLLLALGWRRLSVLPVSGSRSRRWRPTRPGIPAGMRWLFTTAAASGFLAWAAAGLFLAVIPAVLSRAAQIDNLAIIGGIVGAVFVCSGLSQPFVAHYGAKLAQLTGLSALLASLAALALSGGGSVPVTLVAGVAAGIGHGLAYGGAAAAIDAAAPKGQHAAINSALYVAFYFGAGGPAVTVGLLTLWYPLSTAISWLSAAGVALVPLIIAATVLTGRASHLATDRLQPGPRHCRPTRYAGRLARTDPMSPDPGWRYQRDHRCGRFTRAKACTASCAECPPARRGAVLVVARAEDEYSTEGSL